MCSSHLSFGVDGVPLFAETAEDDGKKLHDNLRDREDDVELTDENESPRRSVRLLPSTSLVSSPTCSSRRAPSPRRLRSRGTRRETTECFLPPIFWGLVVFVLVFVVSATSGAAISVGRAAREVGVQSKNSTVVRFPDDDVPPKLPTTLAPVDRRQSSLTDLEIAPEQSEPTDGGGTTAVAHPAGKKRSPITFPGEDGAPVSPQDFAVIMLTKKVNAEATSDAAGALDKALEACTKLKSKAFFKGQCVRLLQEGPPHCAVGEWLILDGAASSAASEAVARCAVKPCQDAQHREFNRTLLGLDGRCYTVEEMEATCAAGEVLTLDLFGQSMCECDRRKVFWKDLKCYDVFRRGPCPEGLILAVEPTTSYVDCQTNPCQREGEIPWDDGKCYPLDEKGPCEDSEVLQISDDTLQADCEGIDLRYLFFVPWKSCPPGSKRDFLGQCQSGLEWGSGNSSGGGAGPCQAGLIRNRLGNCVKWNFRG